MPDGARPEFYKGTINKFGIDIGFQRHGTIVWAVLSPGHTLGPGALEGNYVGVSARSRCRGPALAPMLDRRQQGRA